MGKSIDFLKNKKILITGGSGYLGSRLSEKLIDTKAIIHLTDIKFNHEATQIVSAEKNSFFHEADLTDTESVRKICADIKPDYIFHFAALLNRERDFSIFEKVYNVNVRGTLNLLNALKDIDYKGFYFSSTSEVYGSENNPPFDEHQLPNPVSPYSLSKLMAENLIQTFSANYNKPHTIFRIFNFYGSNMPVSTLFGQLLEAAKSGKTFLMTKGEQKRDYLSIDQLIEQILFVVTQNNPPGVINLCSGKSVQIAEFVETFQTAVNNSFRVEKTLPYRLNEIWDIVGSTQKLTNLGYEIKQPNLQTDFSECV